MRKKQIIAAVVGFALGASLLPSLASAEHTRVTNPNALSVEVLGRGMLYTLYFDRVLSDDLVAGIGFGTAGLETLGGVDAGVSAQFLPVYANYYFAREANSLFATAGASVLLNNSSSKNLVTSMGGLELSAAVIPQFGFGFESRADAGFLFRAAGYAMVAKTFKPWFGFSLGYSF